MMTFSAIRGAQIIDVTKDCEFQWGQKPASCYAYLQVSSASGNFTEGETVSSTSASATVFSSYVDGGRVYVTDVSGTFQTGETITGSSSNQTATVDGFVSERSWTSTPNNIIRGTFPNSIISKDIDDYLEWESTRTGSGNIGLLKIIVPKNGIYGVIIIGGVGDRVDSKIFSRMFQWRVVPTYATPISIGMAYASSIEFNKFLGISQTLTFFPVMKYGNEGQEMQIFSLYFYQNNKGTARWRIHNIRILKLVV